MNSVMSSLQFFTGEHRRGLGGRPGTQWSQTGKETLQACLGATIKVSDDRKRCLVPTLDFWRTAPRR